MFLNSILFQDLILVPLINAHGGSLVHEVQHLATVLENFEGFITRIVPPLLIISGLSAGVRS